MKKNFKTALILGLAICGLVVQLACQAQSANSTPANAATPQSPNAAPNPPSSVAAPPDNEAIIKELAEMKARIAQLEAELKANSDANALRTAVGTTVSGETPTAAVSTQKGPVPASAAAPASPEISAERTTKEAPFPGDWTWLNSNGRVVDTPMATKYFVPEFRADVNYTLDYNHPQTTP